MRLKTDQNVIPPFEVLLCPVCGFHYIHPVRVKVAPGNNLTIIDKHGVRTFAEATEETEKAERQRGVRIYLEYSCENGHRGFLIFQFHKGNTFVEHEELPVTTEAPLWRT